MKYVKSKKNTAAKEDLPVQGNKYIAKTISDKSQSIWQSKMFISKQHAQIKVTKYTSKIQYIIYHV